LSAGQDSNAMDKSPVKVKYSPTVSMSGKTIFKSTLMNELNGNPFLSKDRLTRIRNFVYFNNAKDYMTVVSSSSICLIGLGSDCGVFFADIAARDVGSATRIARKRTKSSRNGAPTKDPTTAKSG
jgi:hypothetical protein